jgi:uncharacterized protein YndB with AHSA1/START domain
MSKTNLMAEPGKNEIRMTRVFDAPRDLVFKVWTDPKHIPQWWGPKRLTTVVEKMDVKMGGLWRFVQRDQEGNEFAFHGVYHDIVSPECIVSTFEFEGVPGHVVLETARFEALPDGKTRVTGSSVFQSIEDRDGMFSSGMEEGAKETWERFAELLTTALAQKAKR